MRSRRLGVLAALLAASSLLSCGVGSQVVPPFVQGVVVGPDGDAVEGGPVRLTIPAGALADRVVCSILPLADPPPVDPSAGSVTLLSDVYCVGPRGQDLLVPGTLSFAYDPAALPPGTTVADLVLLAGDLTTLTLKIVPGAVVDPVALRIEDFAFDPLRAVAIGVVTAPPLDMVFQGDLAAVQAVALSPTPVPQSVFLASSTSGLVLPLPLPATQGAVAYQPSPDGSRVLFGLTDPQTESSSVWTADTATGDARVVVPATDDPYLGSGLLGWIDAGRAWSTRSVGVTVSQDQVRAHSADGTGSPFDLRTGDPSRWLGDLRRSPDGAWLLLRWSDPMGYGDRLEVVSSTTAAMASADLLGPWPSYLPTPRWLADSSGLYVVSSDRSTVIRVDHDGSNQAAIYSLPEPGWLLDFVLAPGADPSSPATARCACLYDFDPYQVGQVQAQAGTDPQTFAAVDLLAGGAFSEDPLGTYYTAAELAFHPDGQSVWAELQGGAFVEGVGRVANATAPGSYSWVLAFDAADASPLRTIAASLGAVDIERATGRVLVWIQDEGQDADLASAGLWLLEPDASAPTLLATPGLVPIGPARWLRSWRHAPADAWTARVR